jgi:hypothetical protein
MCVNGKMISFESILGLGVEGMKENGRGMNLSTIYLIYCKNFCKCHSVPPLSMIKKL